MTFDVDRIISFMEKFMNGTKGDIGEQESTDSGTSDTGGGSATSSAPAMKKWESGRTFGKTYMNDPKYKWETGLTRGHGNPVP